MADQETTATNMSTIKVYLNTSQQVLVSKKEGYLTELHTFLPQKDLYIIGSLP